MSTREDSLKKFVGVKFLSQKNQNHFNLKNNLQIF